MESQHLNSAKLPNNRLMIMASSKSAIILEAKHTHVTTIAKVSSLPLILPNDMIGRWYNYDFSRGSPENSQEQPH